jgi:hypothetical protein
MGVALGGFLVWNFFLVVILIVLGVRSPCKISEPFDNPVWCFSNGVKKKKKKERRLKK